MGTQSRPLLRHSPGASGVGVRTPSGSCGDLELLLLALCSRLARSASFADAIDLAGQEGPVSLIVDA